MFSFVLSFLSMSFVFLMGKKWKYAPSFGVLTQLLWFYYFVFVVKDCGLFVSVIGFTIINIVNQFKWIRSDKTQNV